MNKKKKNLVVAGRSRKKKPVRCTMNGASPVASHGQAGVEEERPDYTKGWMEGRWVDVTFIVVILRLRLTSLVRMNTGSQARGRREGGAPRTALVGARRRE